MRSIFVLILFIFSVSTYAVQKASQSISFGPVSIGENRIPISVNDFNIFIDYKTDIKIGAQLIEKTVQWVRVNDVLLLPRIKIRLFVPRNPSSLAIRYDGQNFLFQQNKEYSIAEFYVSLFGNSPIELFENGQVIAKLNIKSRPNKLSNKEREVVDYSCAPYQLEVEGIESEFFSVGCRMSREGQIGDEKNMLEVIWASSDFTLLDGSLPPFVANMVNLNPVEIKVKDRTGQIKTIKIKANFPTRYRRGKTALGFGPYQFKTKYDQIESANQLNASIMLYSRFDLTDDTSLRAFDAFFYNKSLFNNFGLYFAYDVGSAFDDRIAITPLLGFQSINFKQANYDKSFAQIIYPQGFEIVYKHAFAMKNYSLVFGMFFSPTSSETYQNLWIRFGKRYFGEINYLSWGHKEAQASAWGISVGMPFFSFF